MKVAGIPSLEEVDAYPVPELLVPRLERVYGYSWAEASDLVREAKRMLYLRVASGQPVNPSMKVDDAWHEMLMFTEFYQEFCAFIGQFIHHKPTPPGSGRVVKKGGTNTYLETKKNYEVYFEMKPDPNYWG